jgi:hypothetical protein
MSVNSSHERSSSIKDRKKRSASPTSLKDTGKKFFQKNKINKTKGESGKSKLKSKKSTEENMESACNSKKPTSTQDADSTFPIFTFDNDCLLFSKPDGTSKEQKKAQVTQNLACLMVNRFRLNAQNHPTECHFVVHPDKTTIRKNKKPFIGWTTVDLDEGTIINNSMEDIKTVNVKSLTSTVRNSTKCPLRYKCNKVQLEDCILNPRVDNEDSRVSGVLLIGVKPCVVKTFLMYQIQFILGQKICLTEHQQFKKYDTKLLNVLMNGNSKNDKETYLDGD